MVCRPGSQLRIDGRELATCSAVITRDASAWVLTAGHACAGAIGRGAEYFDLDVDDWQPLGTVSKARVESGFDVDESSLDAGYDAAVIVTRPEQVSKTPLADALPLSTFPYLDLPTLANRPCRVRLGRSERRMTGTVVKVDFDFSDRHDIEFRPDPGQNDPFPGDSGSPLMVEDASGLRLAGLFTRLPAGDVMHFLHPAPALNGMGVPLP